MKLIALAGLGLVLAGGVAAASSQADPVTLSMRHYTNSSKWRVFVWYGQVATSAAGEDVEVLGQACLTKGFRLYTATKTVPGGGYEAESVSLQIPYQLVQVDSGTTFPLGYTNGQGLYLPIERMLAEGGYEVESAYEYGFAAPLGPGYERLLSQALDGLRADGTA